MSNKSVDIPNPKGRTRTLLRFVVHLLSFYLLICCTSCVPVEKMIYLQPTEANKTEFFSYNKAEYQLQINDILDVRISSLNQDVNAIFNASTAGTMQFAQATAQTGGDLFYITGYSLDLDGNIDIPFVGKVKVLGLTLDEAHSAVDAKVAELFTNYHLKIRLGGVRFSALGEFNRPGKQVVMQNQLTIFEAIALAGDLTTVADRSEIKLIRQKPEGTHIYNINLLSPDIIASPFYFVQPNDVIYVKPLKQRSWGFGVTGAQTLSAIISTLSTSAALILSVITLRNG